ncbi:MAG: eukaryotic-like serine/threonine-protein kinase [Mucilaginibacter sp.]|nr:eukaryotic-like serine/threonine-protein kinase [Mucilaginibacter sp.]
MDLGDQNVDDEIRDFICSQTDIEIDKYSDVGCNGELYFGVHKIFKERVALKFYHTGKAGLFHKEPQILRKIRHANIIEVLDAKIISGQHAYFLTKEIDGGDLETYMRNVDLDVFTSLGLAQDILRGLSEMHKDPNRLLHRDIKPNNILVDNMSTSAIIADFGSVKYIPSNQTSITASKNSLVYKPCESVTNNEFNCQSDVYQTGLVLFQLLGGFFPLAIADWLSKNDYQKALNISVYFDQQSFIEKIINNRIVKGKLINLDSLPHYVDSKLKSIIKKATHPDLNVRYKSAVDFLNSIYKSDAINWQKNGGDYLASKRNGNQYKITCDSKGFTTEKSVKNNSFRKIGLHVLSIAEAIELVKKN